MRVYEGHRVRLVEPGAPRQVGIPDLPYARVAMRQYKDAFHKRDKSSVACFIDIDIKFKYSAEEWTDTFLS
jgi:hypothetical protein